MTRDYGRRDANNNNYCTNDRGNKDPINRALLDDYARANRMTARQREQMQFTRNECGGSSEPDPTYYTPQQSVIQAPPPYSDLRLID